MTTTKTHLKSEDLDSLLSGTAAPAVVRHAELCAACHAEVEAMRSALGDFRIAATATAEFERQYHPLRVPHQAVAARRIPRAAWGFATAALLLAVGAPVALHHSGLTPQPRPISTTQVATQTTAAISDDALLSGVQTDLTASVPDPLLPLSSSTSTPSNTSTATTSR